MYLTSFFLYLGEGEVYVWGFGILGLGPNAQRVLEPTIIPSTLFGKNPYEPDSKVSSYAQIIKFFKTYLFALRFQVIKIFCGVNQLGAITNTGSLFMWGLNKWGSLGLGHVNNQYFPMKVIDRFSNI